MGENSVLTMSSPSVGRSGKGRVTSHDVRASTLEEGERGGGGVTNRK